MATAIPEIIKNLHRIHQVRKDANLPLPEVGVWTADNYDHGSDKPITKGNIKDIQKSQSQQGKPSLTADQIVRIFVHFPEKRHYERAYRLMHAKQVQE